MGVSLISVFSFFLKDNASAISCIYCDYSPSLPLSNYCIKEKLPVFQVDLTKNMSLCPLPIIISLYFFLHHLIIPVTGALYYPLDNIAVNCGFSGNSTAADGRKWIGDRGSKYITSHGSKRKLISSIAVDRLLSPDPVPYKTARISRSQFTYTFQVSPGIKFIRLHFYPTSYQGFKRSKAFFTVKAGPYTLLSNFSAALTSDALGLPSFAKEFCVNVEENQQLIISFTPSQSSSSDEVYAFVNGIEVISMPTGLYHTPEGEEGAHVVGKKHQFSIDKNIALENAYRLNVGGSSILSLQDTGMFREWSGDSNYLLESSVLPATTTSRIKYTNIPAYTAPQKVYQTSWSIFPDKQANKTFNFTWKLPVDLGFRYMLRFHFCELEYEIKEHGNTGFSIFVNDEVAEAKADITEWSGHNGVAVYRDYVVMMEGDRMEGKRDLLIALYPHKIDNYDWNEQIDAILKGLEVFKLSNPDKNLAGMNPVPLVRASTFGKPNPRKLVSASGGNAIATGVVFLLTMVNIIVYKLRLLSEKVGGKDLSSLPSEGLGRRFSLAEILSVTNNFDDELVVGRGGFGKVYKALMDGGQTSVAIKRLDLKSRQGANEFWTEIDMLSNLRHTHLVSLIGYCDERSEMILVYEYMEYGTLADHLYKINNDGNVTSLCHLSWEQRVNVCIGAARGLDYLHTGTRHGIIHRDVKSTNILLDKEWVSKISDFGLCKTGSASHSRTHVSTDVKGTFGYFDPEYFLTRRLTKKSDVYAFGVVMLEVLCGRPAVVSGIDEDQRSLVLWAQQCMKEKTLDQIIHPILRDQITPKRLMMFAEVAIKCLNSRPNGRPTMADVVVSLECALASDDAPDDQRRVSSSEEEEEEEDIIFAGAVDEQIDENIQEYDALPVAITSTSTSPPVQYNENSHRQKRSKGMIRKVIQRSIAFLAKGMDTRKKKRDYDSNSEQSLLDSFSNSGRMQWDNVPHQYRRFSMTEIREATNDFHEDLKIGGGGFGKVYRGWIDHGTQVAIKCLQGSWSEQSRVFLFEIQARSQLRHVHIVSLIGYCNDVGEPVLVYNYMVNRSLHNHLYPMDSEHHDPLPWEKRLEICIGAARGLRYLHSETTHTIIHRDIRPTKILLDENWVAKVTDFELAKVLPSEYTGITTRVCGTLGYVDPEYIYSARLTKKSDVYSFGMVLLEVLCARKPYDYSLDDDQKPLVRRFRTCVRRRTIDQVIDPYLVGRIAPDCLREFVKIAWKCVLERGAERPSMDEVVGNLQIALQLQQNWHYDIEFDSESHNDREEQDWFRFAAARAYNNMLPYDSAFDIPNTGSSEFYNSNFDSDTD
ncbi:Receptor-like protein kinase [Actinidia chinensis var. chinensis]|uniref:Receptor-like protein kinase n=1 Tax=Actinidia chinensis var. chinensis TaxID=1590841 RepID=A0A2R6RKI5_ACTCC|nr:Receptor-like protein kinase [Actinidia chinensis var. chinensis]